MDIYEHKKSFMERQIRLLNRPMRPPKDWKLPLKSGQLSESVVETVFQRTCSMLLSGFLLQIKN